MVYNFDEIINREGTNALNTDGFRNFLFHDNDNSIEFSYRDDEFIRMWVADMEFATPDFIIEAIRNRLDRRILGYTRIFGTDYYETFLKWCRHYYDWEFSMDHLKTSPGIIPALYELLDYICCDDEKVLIMTPSYAYFKYAAEHNNIELVTSFLKEENGYYTMDYEDIEEKAMDEKVSLCILCNPHNPTGRVWKEEELKKFGKICLDNNVRIISDEIHCDLLRTDQKHIPIAGLFPGTDRIITCMAPSKTFNLAGMNFSNIIIPEDSIRKIWEKHHFSIENPLSIEAAKSAYGEGYEWLSQLKLYLDDNFDFTQKYLEENLPDASFRIPEATYLAWINMSSYLPDEKDYTIFFAKNAGVLLEGGNMFVSNSDGYIRLNLACPRAVLEEGLKRICSSLNGSSLSI